SQAEYRHTVAWKQYFGAAGCHHLQSLGPFTRIALRLLRITGIRGSPDYEIATAQHLALRQIHPAGIIGFASSMTAFELKAPRRNGYAVVEIGIGINVIGRPRKRAAELARVDHCVIATSPLVPIKPRGSRSMAHDSRPRASMLLRFRHKRWHPARM